MIKELKQNQINLLLAILIHLKVMVLLLVINPVDLIINKQENFQ